MTEKSKLELGLEIKEIKDWLIGNPKGNIAIVCEGELEKDGQKCPVTIQIHYRELAKRVGLPFEFNKDYETDAISRDLIGKKYVLKIAEK